MTPLVIIPCSGKKLPRPAPASELYIGSFHLAAKRAALELTDEDHVLILSAHYSFVRLSSTYLLEPYDEVIDSGYGDRGHHCHRGRQALSSLGVGGYEGKPIVLCPRTYMEVCRVVFDNYHGIVWPFKGCTGIGQQLAVLKQIRLTGKLAA